MIAIATRILLLTRTGFAAWYRALIGQRTTGCRIRFTAGTGTVRRLSEAKSDSRSQKSSGSKCQDFIFHVVEILKCVESSRSGIVSFKLLLMLEGARWKGETIAETGVAVRVGFPFLHPGKIEVETREPATSNSTHFRHKRSKA